MTIGYQEMISSVHFDIIVVKNSSQIVCNILHCYITKKLTVDNNGDGKFDQYGFYVPIFPASGPLSIWMLLQWEPFLWQGGGRLINENKSQVMFAAELFAIRN